MIQVVPIRFDNTDSRAHIRTHILTPQTGVTLMLMIEGSKENILSILEDHLLETLSATEWSSPDSDKDFTFVTENYNRFIRNLEPQDLTNVTVALALLKNSLLTISAVGNATAYLVEWEDITPITEPERGRYDFHTLTTGEVSRNAAIYIANRDVQDTLGNELLLEFSGLGGAEFEEVAGSIIRREMHDSLHIIRIAHAFKAQATHAPRSRGRGQLSLIKNQSFAAANYIKNMPVWGKVRDHIDTIDLGKNNTQKYAFLGAGAVVLFLLVFMLFQAFSSAIGSGGNDTAKERILQAKTLIEESGKLTGNTETFEKNITEAENILFELRTEEKYLADIQELQNRIEVLKKEVYDILAINLTKEESAVKLPENFAPLATFEINNKLLIIGKKGLIADYVKGSEAGKVLTYPQEDEAIAVAMNDTGTPYIISQAGRMMTKRQDQVSYVHVTGQEWWDVGKKVKTFNGNLYLLNDTENQIYKHKPGTNGFSQKTNAFSRPSDDKILDFSLDGGYYLLMANGKVGRYLSTNDAAGIVSLTLNKIPGAWNIHADESSEIIGNDTLSYVYIRNGKKLWVFQPNSRRFQDINSLTYVAQLEIQANGTIESISLPRDGMIYITTSSGIFETQFEIIDGKLILK